MRLLFFVVWVAVGFCLCLAGCRAYIGADGLEASIAIQGAGGTTPEMYEGRYDANRKQPQ